MGDVVAALIFADGAGILLLPKEDVAHFLVGKRLVARSQVSGLHQFQCLLLIEQGRAIAALGLCDEALVGQGIVVVERGVGVWQFHLHLVPLACLLRIALQAAHLREVDGQFELYVGVAVLPRHLIHLFKIVLRAVVVAHVGIHVANVAETPELRLPVLVGLRGLQSLRVERQRLRKLLVLEVLVGLHFQLQAVVRFSLYGPCSEGKQKHE